MSQILTEAFFEYPVFTAFLPEKKHRQEFLEELFTANVKAFEKIAGSFVATENEKIIGILLVKDAKHNEPGIYDYLRCANLKMFKWNNLISLRDFFRTIDEMDGNLIATDEESWYVDSLAISPNSQGKGVGSELLHYLDEFVKPGRIMLSTNTVSNSKFYEKNGYTLINFSEENPKFKTWQFEKII